MVILTGHSGWKSVYAVGHHVAKINDLTERESKHLLKEFTKLITRNHDLQVRFQWGVNDVAIWDNRSTYVITSTLTSLIMVWYGMETNSGITDITPQHTICRRMMCAGATVLLVSPRCRTWIRNPRAGERRWAKRCRRTCSCK